jgi:hypothetical protein
LFEALAGALEADQVALATTGGGLSRLLGTPNLDTQIHALPGGVVVTSTLASSLNAKLKAAGTVASTYYAWGLDYTFDPQARTLAVTLKSEQPVQHEYTWHYAFQGVVELPNGNFTATALGLDVPAMAAAPRASLDQRCINYCHAQGIIGVLAACLPALILGPEGYLGCAIGGAAVSASTILCIMHCEGWV